MTDEAQENRKPCIALMGEFSAGKSTLANLLIGSEPLPVQVIATRLPPVWISYGNRPAFREDLNGDELPIDLKNLAEAPLHDTAYIKIFFEEDILRGCDLLDMPGISDPNMDSAVWRHMISKADGMLWCSPATQAWRQSEAAVWAEMPAELYDRSLLLLTRIDKINTDEDRERVVKRVRKETRGLFEKCLPISLIEATGDQEDYDTWSKSGAPELAKSLAELLRKISAELDGRSTETIAEEGADPSELLWPDASPSLEKAEAIDADPAAKIVPRRVSVSQSDKRPSNRRRLQKSEGPLIQDLPR